MAGPIKSALEEGKEEDGPEGNLRVTLGMPTPGQTFYLLGTTKRA